MKHYFQKKYREKFKDSFTKGFDEIYAEYSKPEKIGHWVFLVGVVLFIVSIWTYGAWWR